MSTVPASIPVLRWAAERAGLSDESLTSRFPRWRLWLEGEAQPTLRQLEKLANITHTSFGYFFLAEPPQLDLPIPDYRTVRDQALRDPSSNLLDTIYLCQQRQEWYRQYARMRGQEPMSWVGSAQISSDPMHVANEIRSALKLSVEDRRSLPSWTEALRHIISKAEELGVLVMLTSVVGSNVHRKLDADEFRGFALSDPLAPLIFLNGADSRSAIMFTLGHELAHLWLGATGVSDSQSSTYTDNNTERWCNHVAAELLVPLEALRESFVADAVSMNEVERLARFFKVSTLVVLRRLHDANLMDRKSMWKLYQTVVDRYREREPKASSGGDFYRSLGARTSKRFARAVVGSTLEGLTSYTEAFQMLGMRSARTLHQAARELGVVQWAVS